MLPPEYLNLLVEERQRELRTLGRSFSGLATAHREASPARRPVTRHGPDEFFASDALLPDPTYIGLRSIVTTGRIGRLVERFSAWWEHREERRTAAERAVSAADRIVLHASTIPTTTDVRERHQHDLAT